MSNLPKITAETLQACTAALTNDMKAAKGDQILGIGFKLVERLSEGNPLLQFLISTISANTKDPTGCITAIYSVLNAIDHQLGANKLEVECNGTDRSD